MKLISVKRDSTANQAVDKSDHPPVERYVQMILQVARADGYTDEEIVTGIIKVLEKTPTVLYWSKN
jgi:hypothetical protein